MKCIAGTQNNDVVGHCGRLLRRWLVLIGIALSLVGCASGPKGGAATDYPAWWLNPPADSATTLIGLGEALTQQQAVTQALASIAGKLSTNIASDMKRRQVEVSQTSLAAISADDTERVVRATVSDVGLSNYQVLETQTTKQGTRVMVALDRAAVAKRWDSELATARAEVNDFLNTPPGSQRFALWFRSVGVIEQARAADAKAMLLLSLNPEAQVGPTDLTRRASAHAARLASEMKVAVQSNNPAIASQLSAMLAEAGLSAQSCSRNCDLTINVQVTPTMSAMFGETLARYDLSAQLLTPAGVASRASWTITGSSVGGAESAQRAADQLTVGNLREEGLWKRLGMSSS